MDILEELRAIVGPGHVLTDQAVRDRTANWGTNEACLARALVRPATTAEVSAVLKLCSAQHIAVVAHGGRTGLSQGAVARAEDIVLSLERMNGVEEIDVVNRTLVAQAGTPLQTAQEKAKDAGLLLALDLGARGTATIGGNVATNAGGETVLRYGTARDQILGLEVVLADGTILSSLNRLIKNNSGYDLKHLFIGSEGTLGIVTRAVLRLRPLPVSRQTALVAVPSFAALTSLLHEAERELAGALTSFEVMWQDFYRQVTTPPAAGQALIAADHPYYILMEARGADESADAARFETLMANCLDHGIIVDAVIAQSEHQAHSLWALREDVSALSRNGQAVHFDIGLALGDLENYVGTVRAAIRARYPDAEFFTFGHLADNNTHICICLPALDEATRKDIKSIVYGALGPYQNAVSAEHGIGLEKVDYLKYSRTPEEIAVMRSLKKMLDPHHILNPDKIFRLSPP